MTLPRTPPKGDLQRTPDHSDLCATEEPVGYPIQRLSAVTRKSNEIEQHLPYLPESIPVVKSLFKEYLDKVDALYNICSNNNDSWYVWLAPHKMKIDSFRERINELLYPTTLDGATRPNSLRKSKASNSTYLKLAEERAKLKAKKETEERMNKLDEEELTLKFNQQMERLERQKELLKFEAQQEADLLRMQQAKDKLKNQELERGLHYLEENLSQNSVCSLTSEKLSTKPKPSISNLQTRTNNHCTTTGNIQTQTNNDETTTGNKLRHQPGTVKFESEFSEQLVSILSKQSEISNSIARNQLKHMLPNKEINNFDGRDITKFKSFMINFRHSIEQNCDNDRDKLCFLLQYTSDRAHKLVASCCHYDSSLAYNKAVELLEEEFGNEFKVSTAYLEKLDTLPLIKNEDPIGLENLSLFLLECKNYFEHMSIRNQLQSPNEMAKIISKLPYKLRDRWRRIAHKSVKEYGTVYFDQLVSFISDEASLLKQPLFGNIDAAKDKIQSVRPKKLLVTHSEEYNSKTVTKYCEYCKKTNHFITSCKFFGVLANNEKSKFIIKAKLCFSCLRKNHFSSDCTNKSTCAKCNLKHPTILHNPEKTVRATHNDGVLNIDDSNDSTVFSTKTLKSRVMIPVVPVEIKINGKSTVLNCALDNASTDCWINDKVLSNLAVNGHETTVTVTTMESKDKEMKTKLVNNLIVKSIDGDFETIIPIVYSKDSNCWPFSPSDLITKSDIESYSHLKHVPFNFVNAGIDLLIGMSVPYLLKPLEVIDGGKDEPFAVKYELGWTFNGPIKLRTSGSVCHRVKITSSNFDEEYERYLSKEFYEDSNGKSISDSDKKWLNNAEQSLRKVEGNKFELALPLKPNYEFPNNKCQVLSMYKGLTKRLLKDESLFHEYSKFMQMMIENNFAELVPDDELNVEPGKCWYLNHHPVWHKVKKSIRVVFNCSLKFCGISLNDNLLQGPDLTNNLLGVLLRFRQGLVAFTGDIEKMFYQVKVPKSDSNFMRFFWTDNDCNVREYRLTVHVFGATSSPSIANYALRQTVTEANCSIETKNCILKNFYVDDCLKSVDTVHDSTQLLTEIKQVLFKNGFNLTGLNSNSEELLDYLANDKSLNSQAPQKLVKDSNSQSRVLGVTWDMTKDKLGYDVKFCDYDLSATKRNLLKILASVYDPLGLASPSLIPAKRLFQQCCRLKLSWDDLLPGDLEEIWKKWLESIINLKDYKITRCLKLKPDYKRCELHYFCDGSETAYGAVCYMKLQYMDEEISTVLLASKSRLTPLNNSTLKTVPRIELCSAKLAVELHLKLREELEYKMDNVFFWSDSTTILGYIKNESKRFHRFVENKLNFIKNYTSPCQWNYVSTKENPADIVSRGSSPDKLIKSKLWNYGPNFLSMPNLYPQELILDVDETDVEVKRKSTLLVSNISTNPIDKLMESTSSWFKLRMRISALVKFKNCLLNKMNVPNDPPTMKDLINAENIILKYLQEKYYSKEIRAINEKRNLPKISPLRKLNPFLDNLQILRVGGRLGNSSLPFDTKHPVIVPPCAIAELLIKQIHHSVGHMGRDLVLSQLRQKYWIVRANSLTRIVLKNCFKCKKLYGKPGEQLMSDLPATRVCGDVAAFAHTGLDYFGPFIVYHGRKSEKRYGVIFTCMNTRAIHIEISHSLTTDSFINSLRRFLCRRGNVKTITSDNGTNLVCGNKELKDSIKEWNQASIDNNLKQVGIQWKFNPPAASHFGGVFEREIRTIRKILTSLLADQPIKLNDENLCTLMCEIESILNNRPLTELSNDPVNFDALTPNHLLLLGSQISFPPGLFDKKDIYAKRKWKQVQYLANTFWQRWRKEYLVLLQQRQKWQDTKENFNINDLVLVSDVNLPRNDWPLARVVKIYPDKNGLVRSVRVKLSKCKFSSNSVFQTSEIDRPIVKLVKLT